MRPLLLTNVIFLALCVTVASASRSKRQIIFEDNDSGYRNTDRDCQTPDSVPGTCERWSECRSLRRITRWDRLKPYTCGFEGNEPKVCCPLETRSIDLDNNFVTATRRPPTRRTTRRRPVTQRPVTQRPTTKRSTSRPLSEEEGHEEKPRFLPLSCGIPGLNETHTKIVGGNEAKRGAWPWMAVVFVEKKNGKLSSDCGGALVTNRHVITAAHCVVNDTTATTLSPQLLRVRLGAYNLSNDNEPESVQVAVDAVRRHELFDPRSYKNDIAVLRLNQEVPFTDLISPVCLPYDGNFSQEALTDKTSTVIGFGTTTFNGRTSDVLREATFKIQSQEICKTAYQKYIKITDEYMCAGTADGSKDACQGDSGGPLVTIGTDGSYYLVGVVSFGHLCAQHGYPGVYTRITKYLSWLRNNLAD